MSCFGMAVWLLLIVAVILLVAARSAHNEPLILVDAAVPICPKLKNPCDKIDCDKPVKGYIA